MPGSRLLSVRDLFVISCHDASEDAKWNDSQEPGGCKCSVCNSVHPDEFISALKARQLKRGWRWGVKDQPIEVKLEHGVFFAEHLKDMTVEWLHTHAIVIFEATGVLFYWDRESLQFQPVHHNVRTDRSGKLALSEDNVTNAIQLNQHYFNLASKQ